MCVFHNENYINLLQLLMKSFVKNANIKDNTDILIVTSPLFLAKIKVIFAEFNIQFKFYLLNLSSLFEAGCSRLNIFNYTDINLYKNILYLDTDILINGDINSIFNLNIEKNKLYALEEGEIGHEIWGGDFFDFSTYDKKQTAFSSGVLYFYNDLSIKQLFYDILGHIKQHVYKNKPIPQCLDQPFIVYNAISQNKYDNQLMKPYVTTCPTPTSNETIHHFAGGPGSYSTKYNKMIIFWNRMNKGKVNVFQGGGDGFGHQLEGTIRLLSLHINKKVNYVYNHKKNYSFEHKNFNKDGLINYITSALNTINNESPSNICEPNTYTIISNNQRTIEQIITNDNNYNKNIYYYDGVGCGASLPPNFENNQEIEHTLPLIRKAFVENMFLPKPSYDSSFINVVCHIRLGDAVGTRILDNVNICKIVRKFQENIKYRVTIHSNGNIESLASNNTILKGETVDVLNVLSDFINADILLINYSALSISAHLLADPKQIVICPDKAGITFQHRILKKCIKCSNYKME